MSKKQVKTAADAKPVEGSSFLMAVLAVGVIGSFTLNGITMEKLTGREAKFGDAGEKFEDASSFLILAQSIFAAVSAALVLTLTQSGSLSHKLTAGVSPMKWLWISIAFLGAHKFGYGALAYISFPLQVLVKCCKPIPVLIGEVALGASYPAKKYLSVVLLVGGVMVFMAFQPSSKGDSGAPLVEWNMDTAYGLGLLFAGLTCDAYYGPAQKVVKQNLLKDTGETLTAYHNMCAMNVFQGLFAFVLMMQSGKLNGSLEFIGRHQEVQTLLLAHFITYTTGAMCIFELVSRFGALTATTVTTLRKLISIMASVVLYGRTMAPMQYAGVAIVVFSKYLADALAAIVLPAPKKKDE